MLMKRATIASVLLTFLVTACSAATPVGDEHVGCRFTYEDDSGSPPFECVVLEDSEETCLDAGMCYCRARNPEGTDEEIEECLVMEIMPRAMVTLSDYCGPWAPMSLTEALSAWASDRGAVVVAEPACDDMLATLDVL